MKTGMLKLCAHRVFYEGAVCRLDTAERTATSTCRDFFSSAMNVALLSKEIKSGLGPLSFLSPIRFIALTFVKRSVVSGIPKITSCSSSFFVLTTSSRLYIADLRSFTLVKNVLHVACRDFFSSAMSVALLSKEIKSGLGPLSFLSPIRFIALTFGLSFNSSNKASTLFLVKRSVVSGIPKITSCSSSFFVLTASSWLYIADLRSFTLVKNVLLREFVVICYQLRFNIHLFRGSSVIQSHDLHNIVIHGYYQSFIRGVIALVIFRSHHYLEAHITPQINLFKVVLKSLKHVEKSFPSPTVVQTFINYNVKLFIEICSQDEADCSQIFFPRPGEGLHPDAFCKKGIGERSRGKTEGTRVISVLELVGVGTKIKFLSHLPYNWIIRSAHSRFWLYGYSHLGMV
eukprot:sb/3465353/